MESARLTLGRSATRDATPERLDPADDELASEDAGTAVATAPPFAFGRSPIPISPDARRRDSVYRRLLAVADTVSLVVALVLGVVVVDGLALTPIVLLAIPVLIVVTKALGLYDRDQHLIHKSTLDEVPKIFHEAVLVAFCAFLVDGLLVDGGGVSPLGLLTVMVTLFLGMTTLRALSRRIARELAPPERCVVIGDQALADELAQKVASNPGTTVEFVGRFDEPAGGTGMAKGTAEFLKEEGIQRVVLAPGAEDRGDILALVGQIKSLGVKISVLPSVSQAGGISFELDRIAGVTLLGMRGFEFNRSSQILKRAMDIAFSGAVLVTLSPLLALIAAAITLTSRGPVFFRQTRIGRHGEPFEMLKFRTMHENAADRRAELEHLNEAGGGLFKIADDPRVTRVGRILRSLSLDELPQLINVLRGEMSLVGPRPLISEEDRLVKGWHRNRLALTPGMTGHWQVLGSARIPLDEMVKLDYAYVQNWSAWHDIQLLLRTIPFVATRRGL